MSCHVLAVIGATLSRKWWRGFPHSSNAHAFWCLLSLWSDNTLAYQAAVTPWWNKERERKKRIVTKLQKWHAMTKNVVLRAKDICAGQCIIIPWRKQTIESTAVCSLPEWRGPRHLRHSAMQLILNVTLATHARTALAGMVDVLSQLGCWKKKYKNVP